MTSTQVQWWRRLHDWADVIHADFQTVISRYLQNVSTYLFCTAERMLRTIIMQNSGLIHACFPIKIDEVWIDRFCVRYDWWRRLQCPQCAGWLKMLPYVNRMRLLIWFLSHPDDLAILSISSGWLMDIAGCHPDDLGCCPMLSGWDS